MRTRAVFSFLLVLIAGSACGQTLGQASGPWILEKSGTTAGLRGIHAVGGGAAWASGTNGTVLRTEDGGYEWQSCAMPPDAEKLDFRGIWAWDDNTAIVMSSGTGDASRLYKTTDGCSSWKLLFTNPDKDGFWDAMVFQRGLNHVGYVLGDPVNGSFVLDMFTVDGLHLSPKSSLPPQANRESTGAFAASNSSLAIFVNSDNSAGGWIGTSGGTVFYQQSCPLAEGNLVIRSVDCWRAVQTPLAHGNNASGVFSVEFRDLNVGMAVGGDYQKPSETAGTAAWSSDGGKTWTAAEKPPHGFRSAVAWDADLKAWIAAGTNGSDISWDDGKTWQPLDDGNWNALSLPWVVGPGGRIAKLDVGKVKR
jgi:photosystem II stability/assembly factor-like uncharacterized protein